MTGIKVVAAVIVTKGHERQQKKSWSKWQHMMMVNLMIMMKMMQLQRIFGHFLPVCSDATCETVSKAWGDLGPRNAMASHFFLFLWWAFWAV
jgi:hypothetical protein